MAYCCKDKEFLTMGWAEELYFCKKVHAQK
jgi:hypothetical protein